MKALAEKLAKLFLVLLFLIGIEGIDVHAAVSYPNMLPDAELSLIHISEPTRPY